MKKFRTRVEKQPRETHERYYPEYAETISETGVLINESRLEWKSVMDLTNSGGGLYRTDLEQSEHFIKMVIDNESDHTIKIIPYED